MNIMRVSFTTRVPGVRVLGESEVYQKDYIFHKHTLLTSAQRALEKERRSIVGVEFFPGDALTEKEIAQAIAEDRFIGV